MYGRYRIYPLLAKGVRSRTQIIPLVRYFSSITKISAPKYHFHLSKGLGAILITGGVAGSLFYFLEKTSRIELLEYAREHKNTILRDGSWRDAMALGLVDMYRSSGNDIITLMHCGRFLGKYVSDDD